MKLHLWTLPRWFAAPFFLCSILLGGLLAGGIDSDVIWAAVMVLLIMAGGHSFNSYLDYALTGLDKGDEADRSAAKEYSSGQSVIAQGKISEKAVAANATVWYLLSIIPLVHLVSINAGILWLALFGMIGTLLYSLSKFTYFHELVLGIVVGPVPLLIGVLAANPAHVNYAWLLASVPFAITLSFLGLALDEWPDAEANLKKGVKSIAYRVWEFGTAKPSGSGEPESGVQTHGEVLHLKWYVSSWLAGLFIFQTFLVSMGILASGTVLTFLGFPVMIMALGMMPSDEESFPQYMRILLYTGVAYCILLVVGQAI